MQLHAGALRRCRWWAALTCVAAMVTVSGALAAPAVAYPANAYWYVELDLPHAWNITRGAGVTVAVIDTGVKASLGDLNGQVLPGKDYTTGGGDGRQDAGPPDNPLFGHGTDMAALIAGTGRGAGLIGVAPQATILPVRVGTATKGA